jgi:hypothetical protein
MTKAQERELLVTINKELDALQATLHRRLIAEVASRVKSRRPARRKFIPIPEEPASSPATSDEEEPPMRIMEFNAYMDWRKKGFPR